MVRGLFAPGTLCEIFPYCLEELTMRNSILRTTAITLLASLASPCLGQAVLAGPRNPEASRQCDGYAQRLLLLNSIRIADIEILENPGKYSNADGRGLLLGFGSVFTVGAALGTLLASDIASNPKLPLTVGGFLTLALGVATVGVGSSMDRDQKQERRKNDAQLYKLRQERRPPTTAELGDRGQGYVQHLGALHALMKADRVVACRYIAQNAELRARIDRETNDQIAGRLVHYRERVRETPGLGQTPRDSVRYVNRQISDIIVREQLDGSAPTSLADALAQGSSAEGAAGAQ
jgi:hypothetical protein